MEQTDRDTIQRNIKVLSDMVDLGVLHRELIGRGVIDQLFVDRIRGKYTVPQEQAQEFFLSYTKRGPQAFQILVEALEKSGHISEARALRSRSTPAPVTTHADSISQVSSTTGESYGVTSSQGDVGAAGHNSFDPNSSSSSSPTSSTSVPNSPQMRHNLHHSRVEPLSGNNSPVSSSSPISTTDQLRRAVSRCSMDDEQELVIRVKEAVVYNNREFDAYKMMSRPRGYALIVNNIEFMGDVAATRLGAEKDTVHLAELLKQLGFEVMIRHNVKKAELLHPDTGIIKKFIDQFKIKAVDACVVAIMSHGEEGRIRSNDPESSRNPLSNYWNFYGEILSRFNNRYCPVLNGKPKMFIVQACQGNAKDRGVRRTQTDGKDLTTPESQISSSFGDNLVSSPTKNIPETEDIVVCYSTVPGFVSNRDTELGTWYIRCLCKVFMENAWNTEFILLLRKVGWEMRGLTSEDGNKQMCSFHVMGLHKSIYFNPGLYPDNSARYALTQ